MMISLVADRSGLKEWINEDGSERRQPEKEQIIEWQGACLLPASTVVCTPGIGDTGIFRALNGAHDEIRGRSREPGTQAGRPLRMYLREYEERVLQQVLRILLLFLEGNDLFARRRNATGIALRGDDHTEQESA
jgi:hypothetical protein